MMQVTVTATCLWPALCSASQQKVKICYPHLMDEETGRRTYEAIPRSLGCKGGTRTQTRICESYPHCVLLTMLLLPCLPSRCFLYYFLSLWGFYGQKVTDILIQSTPPSFKRRLCIMITDCPVGSPVIIILKTTNRKKNLCSNASLQCKSGCYNVKHWKWQPAGQCV